MPEGPQVRAMGNLIGSFAGRQITQIDHPKSRQPWDIKLPVLLESVEVVGKNIFIHLGNGQVIYNHMLMWGWWYPTHNRIGKKRLNTAFYFDNNSSLGYFGGGILKLIDSFEADSLRDKIGPELMASRDWSAAFAKVRASSKPIGEALLEQSLVAGIGNIYKSEGLFVARINPILPACTVGESGYARLFDFLRRQMLSDVKRRGPIITTTSEAAKAGQRNFVYRRRNQPCLLCGTKIVRIMQQTRSTYFCPHCQPLPTRDIVI
jgi:endonuclease VIII